MKLKVFLALAAGMAATGGAHAATNLVVNGDFSEGNFGFTSGYAYVAPGPRSMIPESVYTITSDPHAVHPFWVTMTGDKPMMVVNGATHAGETVWQESLATVAGQAYRFSASAADVCCNAAHPGTYAPSELEFEVSANNFATFTTLGTIDTAPPGDAGQFQTATATFTATGAMEIRVVDALTGRVGNDFALDDIGVFALPAVGDPSDPTTRPPSALDPSAVPEPASWSLMILGFMALGASVRASRGRARRLI